ncbi:GNAT family N-acetyltransferase [candidate division NPL-UPA2 bacterium]|nr:GNAT family N-acetyltransferase [candidate division NPL-UPA2 bacterium]
MIRKLEKNDEILRVAHLIYQTDTLLFSFLFGKTDQAIPKLMKLISRENNLFSYKNILVYHESDRIKGILVGYHPAEISPKEQSVDLAEVFSVRERMSLFFKRLILKPLEDKKDVKGFYLQNIAVDESYRGKGIGSKLMEYYFRFLKQQGIKALFIDVSTKNGRAKHLYEKMGFSVVKKARISFLDEGIYRMKKVFG